MSDLWKENFHFLVKLRRKILLDFFPERVNIFHNIAQLGSFKVFKPVKMSFWNSKKNANF